MGQMMLKALFGRIWPYIAVVGAVLACLFAVRQSGKAEGGRVEKERQLLRDAQGAKAAQENRQNVEALDDNSLAAEFDRLRDKRRQRMSYISLIDADDSVVSNQWRSEWLYRAPNFREASSPRRSRHQNRPRDAAPILLRPIERQLLFETA